MTLSKCYKHNFTAARILLPTRCAWRDVARGYVMVLSNEKAENGCVLRNSFHPLGVACLRGRGTSIFQHPFKQLTETSQALWLSLRGPLLFFCRDSGNLKPFAFLHLKTWRTEAWLAAQMGRVICEFGVLRNFLRQPANSWHPKIGKNLREVLAFCSCLPCMASSCPQPDDVRATIKATVDFSDRPSWLALQKIPNKSASLGKA